MSAPAEVNPLADNGAGFVSITRVVHWVADIRVAGGRYAMISHGLTGEMDVKIGDGDLAAELFERAEEMAKDAREAARRADVVRMAAWRVIKDREVKR